MTQQGAEDVKDILQSKHLESLIDTGLSEEETAIIREYKGTKGKKNDSKGMQRCSSKRSTRAIH